MCKASGGSKLHSLYFLSEVNDMCEKHKSKVLTILTLIVIMAGMYFEGDKMHSLFAYNANECVMQTIEEWDDAVTDSIGMYHSSNVDRMEHKKVEYKQARMYSAMAYMVPSVEISPEVLRAEWEIKLPKLYGQSEMLSYIHNEDGKKRV